MKMKKTIARILSILLVLMLIPVTSFAVEWHGTDISEGETMTLTHDIGYGGNSTIRGELIIENGGYLSAGIQTSDTLTVSGKITIKNGGTLFNQIPLYNSGLIIVESGGRFENNYNGEYQYGIIFNEGDIVIERGATFINGNISGEGMIYDLNKNQNIMPGIIGIENYNNAEGYSYVYFGNNQNYNDGNAGIGPIKWRVLDADKGNAVSDFPDQPDTLKHGQTTVANSDAMFLLSDSIMSETKFNDADNAWQNSNSQSWCLTFVENAMKPIERNAVLAITKNDPVDNSNGFVAASGILDADKDKVFFLSGKESTMAAYGFSEDCNENDSHRADGFSWWLRSGAETNPPFFAGTIITSGRMMYYHIGLESVYARPAFNLDKNSVLFSSKAEGGKASGAVGPAALKAVPDNSGREWKLTLKDASRNFNVTTSACTGKTVYVTYQGATPYHSSNAPNEYISAITKNEFGVITYYGRIAKPTSASGQTRITLPDDFDGSRDRLYVFSEQYNNDKYTDYASEPVEIQAAKNAYVVKNNLTNIISSNKQSYLRYNSDNAYTTTLTANSGFALPSTITVMIGDEELAASEYTYRSGKLSIPKNRITGDIEIIAKGVKQTQIISDISETGDDSNVLLWLVIAVIAALIALSVIFAKRRHS